MRALLLPAAIAAMGCSSILRVLAEKQAREAERRFPPCGQFVEVDGVRLHYLRKGQGQPVVLLHGNDGSLLDFSMSIMDELAKHYDVIAFDRPGHGYSDLPRETLTVDLQSRLLRVALAELSVTRPVIVGHSWSAMLALHHAAYVGDVRGLVLLGAMAYPDSRQFSIFDFIESPLKEVVVPMVVLTGKRHVEKALFRAFAPDEAPAGYVEAFTALMLRPKQIKALSRDHAAVSECLKGLMPRYKKLAVPVVLITGDEDMVVEARHHSCALHKELPDSELILLHGAGHSVQFTHQDEIVKAVDSLVLPGV